MIDLRQAAQQALEALTEALENVRGLHYPVAIKARAATTALREALAQPEQEPPTCTWLPEDDDSMPGTYASSCGELWSFIEGGWKENNVRFCHGCGGKVVDNSKGQS